jgi:hypothetical protein
VYFSLIFRRSGHFLRISAKTHELLACGFHTVSDINAIDVSLLQVAGFSTVADFVADNPDVHSVQLL